MVSCNDKNNRLDLQVIKDSLCMEYEKLEKDFCIFFRRIDYDEKEEKDLTSYEAISSVDPDCIHFNSAEEERVYDNYQNKLSSLNYLIQTIAAIISEDEDKKISHRNKKNIEMLIRDFRQLKHQSEKIIKEEQSVIHMADEKLAILENIRTELNMK